MTARNGPELKCVHCGYALHGIPADDRGVFRCPECGESVSIMEMVDRHGRAQRRDRSFFVLAICLLLTFGAMTLFSTRGPRQAIDFTGILVVEGTFFTLVIGSLLRYRYEMPVSGSLIAAAVPVGLVMATIALIAADGSPLAWLTGGLAGAWLVGFQAWASARDGGAARW